MKILVCGGRSYKDWEFLENTLDRYLHKYDRDLCIITGGAIGADDLAADWCVKNGIPCAIFDANWKYYGNRAGPIRNKWMLIFGNPDMIIAFPGGSGTKHMMEIAKEAGIEIIDLSNPVVF